MTVSNVDFYQNIPSISNIKEITVTEHYHDVPENWYIALVDVVNSTQAIENGKYKDVNTIAAASITALLNRVKEVDIPFVFGGDGATIVIPPEIVPEAYNSLLATQELARASFGLELRAGLIPVKHVLNAGYEVKVARLQLSENYSQAIFSGGGTAYAEKLLKDNEHNAPYMVNGTGKYDADFSGFECRWNAIRSASDETVSLLVQATPGTQPAVYRDVLDRIDDVYGDRTTRHPIIPKNMRLAMNPFALRNEALVKFNNASLGRLLKMLQGSIFAAVAIRFNLFNWGSYPKIFIEATDNEKFDDTLRMTISGTVEQRKKLLDFLEKKHRKGELLYGIHTSKFALVTCIIYDYFGRQVHFVDGADGGYAIAAKGLKAQLRQYQLHQILSDPA